LLSGVRAPDGLPKEHPLKMMVRWYRRCILFSAYMRGTLLSDPYTDDHGGSFTGPWDRELDFKGITQRILKSVDEVNVHYLMHFIHVTEILGYKHPDESIRAEWHQLYLDFADDLHLNPETEQQMDERLGEK